MKVSSPLANMEIGIGTIQRRGNELVLRSGPGSTIDAEIAVSADEVVRTIGRLLTTPAGLAFTLGLPWLWARQRIARGRSAAAGARRSGERDINKPW